MVPPSLFSIPPIVNSDSSASHTASSSLTQAHPPGSVQLSPNRLAILLAALAMLGPFSVDTYLPAFPAIAAELRASELEIQQSLTAYMLSFSGMILWHGGLADSFGRRRVVLVALSIFAVGSLACALAQDVYSLWAFRMLQGISAGAGVVIGRAMIRDLYSGPQAARLLSMVTMIFSMAPAIAPIVGGWLVKLLDWRSIFAFLLAYTVVLWTACWRHLPETLPPAQRHPLNLEFLLKGYLRVFRSQRFYLKAGALACNFGGLFLYVAAAPVFIIRHLGLGPDQFGWQFIPAVGGIFCGALLANRSAGRIGSARQVMIGFVFLIGAASANLIYHLLQSPALPWSVLPLFFYTLGMSLSAPALTLLTLDLFPETRGIAASCQSFVQTMLSALIAGMVAPLLSGSVIWLAAGQLALCLLGLTLWQARHRVAPATPHWQA